MRQPSIHPKIIAPLAAFIILFHGCSTRLDPAPEWTHIIEKPQAISAGGMVVSDEARATHIGVEVLNQGGNAIDAAVATAFALAVVYPEAGNLGGGGFLVAHLADGRSVALDFREKAPQGSTRDMFLNQEGHLTDMSVIGHRAAGVPGSVAGLWEAHSRYGSLPWNAVVMPALQLARDGFVVNERMARTLRADSARLSRFNSSRSVFFIEGKTIPPGTLWKNPDLAATLERIAAEGKEGFYAGPTADRIVAEMTSGNGLITRNDLAAYRAIWRHPLSFVYRGKTVLSIPPSSSGGVTLALICNILAGYDLPSLGWHSTEAIHLIVEAMRRAFAVRNSDLGDPDFVHISLDTLLSEEFTRSLRSNISPDRATPSAASTIPSDRETETTHLGVVDAKGNAVSLTTTLNSLYGNAVTVQGAGFLLNNEMDDFAVKPGAPNMFDLVQGEANAIAPGKRMLSSMTPTIVLDSQGSPFLVTGARGGPHIITSVFHLLSNILDYGMDLPQAITAPRFHHQHLPDQIEFEERGVASGILKQLREMGYDTKVSMSGSAPSLLRTHDRWIGFGDPRSEGTAEGQVLLP
jgi:gamma-glutamyltranspeptidase/glutathione hydrolase